MGRDLEPVEVLDGVLVDLAWHALCSDSHPLVNGVLECCCGDTHQLTDHICCGCGHHHDIAARCLPTGPCGSFLCCID
jgi:hypothetical protein